MDTAESYDYSMRLSAYIMQSACVTSHGNTDVTSTSLRYVDFAHTHTALIAH